MARAATAKKKEPKAKQERFEGFEQKEIKEVREALEALKDAVDERLAAGLVEEKAMDEALRVMERNKVPEYRVGNYTFRIHEGKRKIKREKVSDKDAAEKQVEIDEAKDKKGAGDEGEDDNGDIN